MSMCHRSAYKLHVKVPQRSNDRKCLIWTCFLAAWDGHVGVYHDDTIDCTHFCQASNVPSLWSLLLEQHLLEQHLLRHARAVAERVQL